MAKNEELENRESDFVSQIEQLESLQNARKQIEVVSDSNKNLRNNDDVLSTLQTLLKDRDGERLRKNNKVTESGDIKRLQRNLDATTSIVEELTQQNEQLEKEQELMVERIDSLVLERDLDSNEQNIKHVENTAAITKQRDAAMKKIKHLQRLLHSKKVHENEEIVRLKI